MPHAADGDCGLQFRPLGKQGPRALTAPACLYKTEHLQLIVPEAKGEAFEPRSDKRMHEYFQSTPLQCAAPM